MVVIYQKKKITAEDFQDLIQSLGLGKSLLQSNYIVIKPNFSAATRTSAESNCTSDLSLLVDVVSGIVRLAPDKIIYIAESDGAAYEHAYEKFEKLRLEQLFNGDKANDALRQFRNVRLLDLSRDRLELLTDPCFRYFTDRHRQLWLSALLNNSGFIISMANLKTHHLTGVSGACKNLFGVLPTMDKWQYHPHIHDVIHDLVLAVKPSLAIVDGFCGMDQNGPIHGRPVNATFRIWSDSALEADVALCQAAGIGLQKVKHLSLLAATLGTASQAIAPLVIEDQTMAEQAHGPTIGIKLLPPTLFLRICSCLGITLQRMGERLQHFGHRIHNCHNKAALRYALWPSRICKGK
jgi:uncharacterized protein (DUF362 family)